MVLKQIEAANAPIVKWIGAHDPLVTVDHLQHKNVYFYAKCIIGPLTLSVGDFVLVSNADSAFPDTEEGCDIAKILYLYELREVLPDKDPCRAVVQWYSRPECIPHKHFDDDTICIDFNAEVIEEHRPYDADISLETIYRKCSVICGSSENSAAGLLQGFNAKRTNCPMFVCRYKFIKVKNSYRLEPLQFSNEDVAAAGERGRRRSTAAIPTESKASSAKKPRRSCATSDEGRKRRSSVSANNPLEFVDLAYFNEENKVSPIKIIGGRSVVRLSAKKKQSTGEKYKGEDEINANYLPASPLAEQNIKVTPRSRAAAAKRNLNLSLDNGADTTADSDCLNYSIVKGTPDRTEPPNEMKIKLRLSERRRSTRLSSMEEDPLAIRPELESELREVKHKDSQPQTPSRKSKLASESTPSARKKSEAQKKVQNADDIYHTPTKKAKETTAEGTPSQNRRKSILKSATTRLSEGTPRRSIQLSSIVEQRVFNDDDIINTPKRSKARKSIALPVVENVKTTEDDEEYTPKKTTQKTPSKGRRSTTKATEAPATPKTPSQKLKMIRSGEIKPTLEKRDSLAGSEKGKTDLQIARERLHVSVVPKSLPCREKEFDNIYTFLEGKIQDQCGGCMYVSGVPGTGKTATVTGVIRMLQQRVAEDDLPPFDFLEINGMRLTEPRQAYVHIYRQLTGKTVSWEHAHALLEKRFTTPAPRRVTTVLLVDELDILCNRRQDVVYNLLDWPTKSAAHLVVVTIANTMDLPERLLMGKVTSRLGLTRLTFQPYTHKQLQEIVTGRLQGSEAFKGDAVQLVARKVAAVSGDARRALDICRRATEIADAAASKAAEKGSKDTQQCVNMLHVQQALNEMISSAKVQAIKNCSRLEQIFLQAVVAEVTRTGVEETSFMGVYTQIETIAAFMGAATPTPGRALRICAKLGSERLLICEHSRNDVFQKILLNVSMDDIHYALKVNNTN